MRKGFSFDDVLLIPKYSNVSSRSHVNTKVRINSDIKLDIPIISASMDTITGTKMAIAMHELGGLGILHRFYKSKKDRIDDVADIFRQTNIHNICIGVKEEDKSFVRELSEFILLNKRNIITIDVAHAHHENVYSTISWLREKFAENITIIAGNIATSAAIEDLINWGVDWVKVGIGPGSMCSTRINTGAGYPQLSAILNCRIHMPDAKIIADGGIRTSGDIVKALAAGANAVMIGNLFAGTLETPGLVYTRPDGSRYKIYRGQASYEAQQDNGKEDKEIYAEGVIKEIPYTGESIKSKIDILMKGIRSGISYCGASSIKQLHERALFVEVTNAGLIESTPYGIS